jgi:FkbM family methyltransferase
MNGRMVSISQQGDREQYRATRSGISQTGSSLLSLLVTIGVCLMIFGQELIGGSSRFLLENDTTFTRNNNEYPAQYYYINQRPNNNVSAVVQQCTEDQRRKIAKQLIIQDDTEFMKTDKKGYGRLPHMFKCPQTEWIESFYEQQQQQQQQDGGLDTFPFLGISVGCNKGDDAIRTARMGMFSTDFDVTIWNNQFNWYRGGPCQQVSSSAQQMRLLSEKTSRRSGEMHCIEPMPSTFKEIKRASDALELESKGFIVSHAAIASARGTVIFPNAMAGREDLGISANNCAADSCEDVQAYSLEQYVQEFVKSTGPVHILQIDVEGWDFDVLFGASSVLDRTHYLEFEYHSVGNWGGLHLPDAIKLLDGKGFTCYWAGQNQLWRITGCYFEVYNHFHGWSNVACVHRSQGELAEIMEQTFLTTLEAW